MHFAPFNGNTSMSQLSSNNRLTSLWDSLLFISIFVTSQRWLLYYDITNKRMRPRRSTIPVQFIQVNFEDLNSSQCRKVAVQSENHMTSVSPVTSTRRQTEDNGINVWTSTVQQSPCGWVSIDLTAS